MPFIHIEYNFKHLLERFGRYILYVISIVYFLWFLVSPQPTCVFPKTYSLGTVDSRFGVTDTQLLSALNKASKIWEDGIGIPLFKLDGKNGLPVNLVYDDRQKRTNDTRELDTTLNSIKNKRQTVEETYNALLSLYKEKTAAYTGQFSAYETEVNDFNKTVTYWNGRNDVTQRISDSIISEQKKLEADKAQLEVERIDINKISGQINNIVGTDTSLVTQYNSAVNSFQSRYKTVSLFDRAVFNGKEINVYEFSDNDTLVLALAHELGHYIGLNHDTQSASLMYYLMQDQDLAHPKLTTEDKAVFENVCNLKNNTWFGGYKVIKTYLQSIL